MAEQLAFPKCKKDQKLCNGELRCETRSKQRCRLNLRMMRNDEETFVFVERVTCFVAD